MSKIIIKNPIDPDTGIFHHDEGIDLRLANIHLYAMEISLVNTISRELMVRNHLKEVKSRYDCVLIHGMPSFGREFVSSRRILMKYCAL